MRLKSKIRQKVHHDEKFAVLYRAASHVKHFCGRLLPDEIYLKALFLENTGKQLNLEHPVGYNAKLQWLKIHDRKPEYTMMADKYEVRSYIEKTIGKEYLVNLYGVFSRFSDIDFSVLPEKFVIKCTHDSGSVVICKDKATFDVKKAEALINKALKKNYYYDTREWPYKDIKPRIVVEEFLETTNGEEIKDYKMFCFNGRVAYTQVHFDRSTDHKTNVYDREWNFVDIRFSNYPSDNNADIEKPSRYDEMIKVAETLSKEIPHVRVDLYYVDDKIYFGELTFFHATGMAQFDPPELDEQLGNMITVI